MKVFRVLALLVALLLVMQCVDAGISAKADALSGGKEYIIWFDEAAPESVEGFERWSLPLGNGYMGINVFGGVETELVSVTENSVFNALSGGDAGKGTLDSSTGIYTNDFGDERIDASSGGLNLFAKTYIDFAGHDASAVSNYRRELSIDDSVAKVSYDQAGVTYTREIFFSYPDKVTVIKLSASEAGKLSFTLRPEIPYCYDPEVDPVKYSYLNNEGDGLIKTGKVTAEGDTITLKGTMEYYGTDFEGLYKVIPVGGTMVAANDAAGKNGTITVENADSAVIILAVGTNYDYEYITFDGAKGMLDAAPDPHEKVQGYLDAAAFKSYDALLSAHEADYKALYERAAVDLGVVYNSELTTDLLVNGYATAEAAQQRYLEELTFQYGRYLLIASSREGCLPANLQGIWNFADSAAWSGGYWHNINVQMNYWPAFNTGLAELFQSYVDYNEAMRTMAQKNADDYLSSIDASGIAQLGTGENGYAIGTGCSPYYCARVSATGHSGPGTGAFTSLLFWDYYEFTQDEEILRNHTYPAVEGMAKFLSKTLEQYEDGKWLVSKSASPENFYRYDSENKKYYYLRTVGTAFDQQMVYANHLATLQAAELLGYTEEEYPILATIKEQIDHLDPVNIGYSGQVKEYREEKYYGEYGEKNHRHISQMVGVYPAAIINSETEAWLEAAGVSLLERGYTNVGWGKAHRLLCWARIQNSDQAYSQLQMMVKEHFAPNLFGIYNATNPNNDAFQIDSNFGYTAGVAEMLVQSHAEYIEFLPALPEAWANGSFTGLTCRGNFAVDAVWKDCIATNFTIASGSGGECAVKHPNVAMAKVVDSKGNAVAFVADGDDLIRFDTVAGETYSITDIPEHTPNLDAPVSLSLEKKADGVVMRWSRVEGAVGYRVYRAVEDASTYELVSEAVAECTFTYTATDAAGKRVTLRVAAVSADGTESSGVTAVLVP